MREFLIAADDRTGAFEVAAELATSSSPVLVATSVDDLPVRGVVDIASRHLPPDEAEARAVEIDRARPRWTAHKIDSLLRGNWVHEIHARRAFTGARGLLVPAWPAMGRTCVDGIVQLHGRPVGRIADHLPDVHVLSRIEDVQSWLRSGDGFAVCDVVDSRSLVALAECIARSQLNFLLAGPAGAIGAVSRAWDGHPPMTPRPHVELPALVVCGSGSEVAREQVGHLREAHLAVEVIDAPCPNESLDPSVARELAARAHARLAEGDIATLVIVGGDTAAAVLGDGPRSVGGYAAAGMPWSRAVDGSGPLVVTKAGAFGGPSALLDLFAVEVG